MQDKKEGDRRSGRERSPCVELMRFKREAANLARGEKVGAAEVEGLKLPCFCTSSGMDESFPEDIDKL